MSRLLAVLLAVVVVSGAAPAAPAWAGSLESSELTIARVQEDQRTLRRAEFNHRAHIIEVRCLECHTRIPITENLDASISLYEIDPASDHAGILNLPGIEVCRECHNPRLASDRCTTCHLFHPDQSRRSELVLYVDGAAQ